MGIPLYQIIVTMVESPRVMTHKFWAVWSDTHKSTNISRSHISQHGNHPWNQNGADSDFLPENWGRLVRLVPPVRLACDITENYLKILEVGKNVRKWTKKCKNFGIFFRIQMPSYFTWISMSFSGFQKIRIFLEHFDTYIIEIFKNFWTHFLKFLRMVHFWHFSTWAKKSRIFTDFEKSDVFTFFWYIFRHFHV